MFEKLKQDFIERFLNFETARGIYLVPAGIVIMYLAIFHVNIVIGVTFFLGGLYAVSDGVRKIFVNRIKQKAVRDELLAKRKVATEVVGVAI
jgi:hypothetical protein